MDKKNFALLVHRRKRSHLCCEQKKFAHGQGKVHFTLIKFLVSSTISSLRFLFRCDQREQQNTPLFLKEKGGAGERGNFFSREKKFPLSPAHSFTLIELLVVIAIIAILAAILLPALQQARARGMATECQNRLRQNMMVIRTYADDYNDLWIFKFTSKSTYGWWDFTVNQGYWRKNASTEFMRNKYVRCPSPIGAGSSINNAYGLISSNAAHMGSSGLFVGGQSKGNFDVYFFRMKNIVSKHLFLADSGVYSSSTGKTTDFSIFKPADSAVSSRGKFWLKHNNRCNVAFGDGHVASLSDGESATALLEHLIAAKVNTRGDQIKAYVLPKQGAQKTIKVK